MKATVLRKVFLNVGIVTIGIVVALVGLEVAFRLYLSQYATEQIQILYTGSRNDFREHSAVIGRPYVNFGLTSHFPGHNSDGYRGEEIQPKQPGEYRIVALGGSTTYGYGLEAHAAYPAQLQEILHEVGLTDVEVINAGVPSYTTWETVANLAFRVVDLQPNLIIIYHAGNDIRPRTVNPEQYDGLYSGRGIWQYPDAQLPSSALYRLAAFHLGWIANPLWSNPTCKQIK